MKKYKLTTNLPLKIIAFVFAAFLWLIVANVANPVTKSTYTNIKVTIANDDVITQGGEVYTVLDDQNVNVVVYAKRSVIQQIKSDDIVATADIKDMDSRTGLIPISVSIPKYSGSYQSAEAAPRNIQIKTEPTGKTVFTLTVSTTGTQRDGYQIGEMKVNHEKITITGAESTVKSIDKAVAKINVDGISKDEELTAELVLYDASGNVINQGQLSNNLGEDGITVDVTVMRIKTVPLKFEASGRPADGYEYLGCSSEPASVQICGKEEALSKIESINIPASELSIAGATEKIEKAFDITDYLPEGVELIEGASGKVTATAMIEQLGNRTIEFMVASIKQNYLAKNLQVSYEPDAEVTLVFQGEKDTLDSLDISNAVSVNLQNYTKEGTYDIPVEVDLPDGVTLTKPVTVQLILTEKGSTKDEQPENNAGTN